MTIPLEALKWAIAIAETDNPDKALDDPIRSIRTGHGSDSSAYGAYQITRGLAVGALKNGLFNSDPKLREWVEKKFIPHGEKLLKSKYNDKVYGAYGKGDLSHDPVDRAQYQRMAETLFKDVIATYGNDIIGVLNDWRFGAGEPKRAIIRKDPRYVMVVLEQFVKYFLKKEK